MCVCVRLFWSESELNEGRGNIEERCGRKDQRKNDWVWFGDFGCLLSLK